jgi:DNA (cytosine-5)-methyltransferase 1
VDKALSRPKLLDLFCGAGGAATGYHQAGFDVTGVDIKPQPHFPFKFIQADAMTFPLDGYDVIHASPPCQAYSVLRRPHSNKNYPDLIPEIRQRLITSGKPWVIENVPGAPLKSPLILCGSMFDLKAGERYLRRHRLFEMSQVIYPPTKCTHKGEAIGVYGHGGNAVRWTSANGIDKGRYPNGRKGGYQGTTAEKREAMAIDWMTDREISQAIPPAYTKFIGEQLIKAKFSSIIKSISRKEAEMSLEQVIEVGLNRLIQEQKRVADRLEMIHNHLVKLPEKDPKLDAKLIKEEEAEVKKSVSPTKPSKESKTTGSKGKGSTAVAEDLDEEIQEADDDAEGVDELFEEESASSEMSAEQLAEKCKGILASGADKEARAHIRTLFVQVLKNTFNADKTSQLKPADRKLFVDTFEKRVKEKK